MSQINFKNNAQTTLTAAVTATTTAIPVASAAGLPAAPCVVVIDSEVIRVTAVSGNTLTVSRGQEGTTAASHATGALVTGEVTAGALASLVRAQHFGSATPSGGASGDLAISGGALWVNDAGIWKSASTPITPTTPPPVTPPPTGGGGGTGGGGSTGDPTLPLPAGMKTRPYTADSPWNTLIPANPAIDSNSSSWIAGVGPLSSNVGSFTFPFYAAPAGTPLTTFTATGIAAIINAAGTTKTDAPGKQIQVPMPAGAAAASGSDGQIIVVDLVTGDEYDMWQVSGTTVKNMTKFTKGILSPGTTDVLYPSRGAGIVYFGGLIRPWEIIQGHIDHALAFAYNQVSSGHRYPATKSDGTGSGLPEGARIQLDPAFDVTSLSGTTRIIAVALQKYGAYVIDFAGNPGKIYAEYQSTAQWGTSGVPAFTSSTVAAIPANRLRELRSWDGS